MSMNILNDISKVYQDQVVDEGKADKKLPDYKRSAARLARYDNPSGAEMLGGGQQTTRRAEHEERRGVKKEEFVDEAKKKPMIKVEVPKEKLGYRVADIGPGGKEYNVKTYGSMNKEALDPVGQEDDDIDNDGDTDKSDKYLHNRRKVVGKAISKKKVKELTISISIDDLLNASGDSAVGQYDDETRELSITLFPVLQKIKYGSGYIGIGMIDDLEEITDEERDIYIGIIKDALTNPRSVEFGKIKDVFVHELVHHWDNVNYGSGYAKNMDDLENTRHAIEDKLQRDKFYFGMPHEINARFIQALSTLMDNHGSGFGDYRTFEEMFLPYFINYSMLSQDVQNKIKKRLFYFFENDIK